MRRLLSILLSRVCRRLAVTVFASVMIPELLVLWPLAHHDRAAAIDTIEAGGRQLVTTMISMLPPPVKAYQVAQMGPMLVGQARMTGLVFFDKQSQPIGVFADVPDLRHPYTRRRLTADGSRMDVWWRFTRPSMAIAARFDTSQLNAEVHRKVLYDLLVMLAIALAVTFVATLTGGLVVVEPLLKMRDAVRSGTIAGRFPLTRRDEIGTVAKAIAEYQEEQAQAPRRLEAIIEERTQELARREAQLRATLENMAEGVAMYDSDQRLVTYNQRFRQYLQVPIPDEILNSGLKFETYLRYTGERGGFGSQDLEELIHRNLSTLHRPEILERVRPDGMVTEVRRYPIAGGGFIFVYADVTERKRAENQLREDEERFRAIDSAAPVALLIMSVTDHVVQHINPRFAELFGTTFERAVGRP